MRKTNSTNYKNEAALNQTCPVNYALQKLGGRWKLAIVWQLREGEQRFSTLQTAIEGISPKMLTQQLRELEADGIVQRSQPATKGPVSYCLSASGAALMPALQHLLDWGLSHQNDQPIL